MTELIGDVCIPSELIIPSKASVDLPSNPQIGTIFLDTTTCDLKVWNGTEYITLSSA